MIPPIIFEVLFQYLKCGIFNVLKAEQSLIMCANIFDPTFVCGTDK